LSDLQQLEADSADLRENAKQRGPIFKPTGEHGLAAHHLIRNRRKAEKTVAPSRPLIRIAYKLARLATL